MENVFPSLLDWFFYALQLLTFVAGFLQATFPFHIYLLLFRPNTYDVYSWGPQNADQGNKIIMCNQGVPSAKKTVAGTNSGIPGIVTPQQKLDSLDFR